MLDFIPENLDFEVGFEPTKVDDKKYVINRDTGEYIAVVGKDFTCASHGEFYNKVMHEVTENLSERETEGAEISWRDAHNNGWAMMDMRLPNVKQRIASPKHETEVSQRIIALHGVNGTCSNLVFFGAIDFFCTNGMIRGDHDKVRRKNTSGFTIEDFIWKLKQSREDFYAQADRLQKWAQTDIATVDVKALLDKIMKSETKSEKMYSLYSQEAGVRGRNVWALYSAFTNYATYADERNGFNLRNTGHDTNAVTMFNREQEVSKWIDTPEFNQLIAA
tara:strand:- start:2260 stop:3090 length:831 start_codon:yes stop_codon:yes gene_type:complete